MSRGRLPVILSHLNGYKNDLQLAQTSEQMNFVWDPPQRKVKTNEDETIVLRAMNKSDVPRCSRLLQERSFVESTVSCAIECPGFLGVVAENEKGFIIGCWMVMMLRSNIRVSGHVNVHVAYRKSGVATDLMKYFAEHFPIKVEYEVFLYGYKEKAPFYKRIGLVFEDIQNTFMTVVGTFHNRAFNTNSRSETVIKRLQPSHSQELAEYDQTVHRIKRDKYIKAICFHKSSQSFVAFRSNSICGYGVLRTTKLSHKIAPLFADNPEVAGLLFRKIVQGATPGLIFVMTVPSLNKFMAKVIEESGFLVEKEWARLREKMNPYRYGVSINYDKVFAMTDLSMSVC